MRQRLYSLEQARDFSGCTYRQVDYWEREGHLVYHTSAQGSGSRRQFNQLDILRMRALHIVSRAMQGRNNSAIDLMRVAHLVREASTSAPSGILDIPITSRVTITVDLSGVEGLDDDE